MLTDRQLALTATQLIDQHLASLLDPDVEDADWIDRRLCDHCPVGSCVREHADMDAEIDQTRQVIRRRIEQLRQVNMTFAGTEAAAQSRS